MSLVEQAAELRASGRSWEAVSIKLKRSARACRRWPQQYPEVWDRFYFKAERELIRRAGSEALGLLFYHLRAENAWLSQNTAKFLFSKRVEILGRELEAEPAEVRSLGEWEPFIAFLEGQSDVEVRAFLDQYLARRVPPADAAVPAGGGGSGPAVGE
jgi:hypothetical protein